MAQMAEWTEEVYRDVYERLDTDRQTVEWNASRVYEEECRGSRDTAIELARQAMSRFGREKFLAALTAVRVQYSGFVTEVELLCC